MMQPDRLHCPCCKSRLTAIAAPSANGFPGGSLRCTGCDWVGQVRDGIADFVGESAVSDTDPHQFSGDASHDDVAAAELIERIRLAAGDRWPASLGEVLELGCGSGQLTRAFFLTLNNGVRGLIVADTELDKVRTCRDRLVGLGLGADAPVMFVRLSGQEDSIRDTVADTVAGTAVLPRIGDVRGFLTTVHRVLKPGGRAFFVVPNRRYHQALCHAVANALVHQYAHHGAWSGQGEGVMHMLARLRRQLVHQGDLTFLAALRDKHLFDSDGLEDLAREVGFADVSVIPVDPDPLGGETTKRLCHHAAVPDAVATELAALVVSAGAPYFSLLSRQDASAEMLVWLTKGVGPRPSTFSALPVAPTVAFAGPEAALGGAPPRWSIELAARDTVDGVAVAMGGWCLMNIDVVWVRLGLDDVTREVPVWRPRPDVHEVLNAKGLYHPLNALCCGLDTNLLFDGLHPKDNRCLLHLEIVLANGMVVKGPVPDMLVMNEKLIVTQ
ncbi:class I SAM-dependent methyltransferase [Rhodopila sp.]|uniref:class I SAM-dependent methyltransferase n=1 Tax=Rhodopila sp. TaxID=2480087 RepID=UPI003D0AE7DE